MSTITVSTTISMGHRLPSYDGICSSPHGHNVTVDVNVAWSGRGFLDFKQVAFALNRVLADFDHAMVLWQHDPLLKLLDEWPDPGGQQPGFRTVALSVEPTTEAIADYIFNQMNLGFVVESVTVHETAKYSATSHSANPTVTRTDVIL